MSETRVEKVVDDLKEEKKTGAETAIPQSGKEETSRRGLNIGRIFTHPGESPHDLLDWERRSASIINEKGEVVFEQHDVEVPINWSQLASNVVISKYFRGAVGTPERENSVRHLIDRVSRTITDWGRNCGYFATETDAQAFEDELTYILVTQRASFNSPVWFNVGVEKKPQCSACFINSVEDKMEAILGLAKTEGMLFKYGSGTGTNLSPLRSSKERLTGGGTASGPVSFMKGFDAFAGVIKSGGRTRRAAKMVILNIDHPDVVEFITCKANEEKKAWALIDSGYDGSLDGEAYGSVFFQNSNNSVRVSDEFMQSVVDDSEWQTRCVVSGEVVDTYKSRDLMRLIAESAHICGDPGIQYDTTVNKWHTCMNTSRINASNPCSEYMFLDDSACNLASLNLMRFRTEDGQFDTDAFRHAVRVLILAQEIIVENSSYPTSKITNNSYNFRPLGLGYANLGALLMANGLPYDSEEGRDYAAAVTALMTGEAYAMSARIAEHIGPFAGFAVNRDPMISVIEQHRESMRRIQPKYVPSELFRSAQEAWDQALLHGRKFGFRNAQVSVLAPTGTIGFMMDCDTTGVEPDIALVKYKKLVGGGMMKIVNRTVPLGLSTLGYNTDQIQDIVDYIDDNDMIEGAPHLKDEDLPVFDCAFKPLNGARYIHYMGHIKMMGAVQPFISGAISKTVNMPNDVTVEEIADTYVAAWRLGLKAVAIYRDGCKRTQPLNTSMEESSKKKDEEKKSVKGELNPARRRLPDERRAITHKFSIAEHEGYITVGLFENGDPGEIFLIMAKEGTVVSGLMDAFATAISLALQYGVPLHALVDKFSHMRFEPSGFTKNPQIPMAKSIIDYIFRWLGSKFLDKEEQKTIGIISRQESTPAIEAPKAQVEAVPTETTRDSSEKGKPYTFKIQEDAPPCPDCGSIMVRNGSCYLCPDCGTTSGCS